MADSPQGQPPDTCLMLKGRPVSADVSVSVVGQHPFGCGSSHSRIGEGRDEPCLFTPHIDSPVSGP
jgi:hypothetical protein